MKLNNLELSALFLILMMTSELLNLCIKHQKWEWVVKLTKFRKETLACRLRKLAKIKNSNCECETLSI